MMPQKRRYVRLSIVLFLVGCLGGFIAGRSGDGKCVFTITIESDRPVETQLFYDTGRGFNESESRQVVVYHQDQEVTLSFLLSGEELRRLRFDPARSEAGMCIRDAVLTCDGRAPFVIPIDHMIPQQGIRLSRQEGGRFCFVSEGGDPILHLGEIGTGSRRWVQSLLYSLGGGLVTFGGAFFIAWLYKRA